jgi:hypothetical protein
MNKSIYKKQLAFKNSLPQYGNGGKKFAAGLAGFASGLPGIGPIIGAATAGTDAVKDNPVANKAGMFGATVLTEGAKMAINPMSAISGAPKIIGSGLDLGSTVAEEKGNTQRAERLDTAAMGMQGVGQIAGMATGMAGQFGGEGGFNFNSVLGVDPTKLGGNTPVVMKNGGKLNKLGVENSLWNNIRAKAGSGKKPTPEMLEQERKIKAKYEDGGGLSRSEDYGSKKKPYPNVSSGDFAGGNRSYPIPTKADAVDALRLAGLHGRNDVKSKVYAKYPSLKKEDGGYTYSTEGAKQGSNYNVVNPANTSNFVEPKKKTISETEKKLMQQQVVQEDGTVTDGLGNIIKRPEERATGAIEESASPIDLIGSGIYKGGAKMLTKGLDKAGSKLLPNAYKLNPKALKEAQEQILVRARPVGQDPYVNMAEQLRAKQAAGEQLTWYQKNLLNPQTNPQMAAREKYYGQWFADNPSDLDFYINPATRNFADDAQIEILKARMPKSEAAKYNVKNFEDAKTLSNLHDTEYILPKNMVQQAERYSVDDLSKLKEEYNQINKPHWLKGYSKIPKKQNGGLLQYNNGGPTDLIKYNLPTHESGGGAIDANGKLVNPNSPLAQAELEKTETLDTKQNYVFSDTLKPMKSKLTFADLSKRIDNKYKDKNDAIATKSKDRELERLAQSNEELRLAKEAKTNPLMMKNGGKLPKYFNGGDYNPYGLGSGTVDTFGTNQTESMNTMTPSVMLGNYSAKNIVPESTIPINTIGINSISTGKSPFTLAGNLENNNTMKKLPSQFVDNNFKSPSINNQQFTTGDKFQLAGLAPATIYNTIQALRPAEKFSPLNSSLFGAGLNDMNQNVRFNTNPILMNRNVGINQINQGSTSDAVRRANLQSLYRGTNTQLGEMAEKEALTNAQIKQSLGQAKIGVGAQDVAAQERARQYNVQARQAKQQFGATAASQFGQGLTEFGKSSNQNLSNRIGYDVLKNISPNFTLTEYNDLVKKGFSDAEIIKFINK